MMDHIQNNIKNLSSNLLSTRSLRRGALGGFIGLVLSSSFLQGQILLEESFQGPLGSVPANWRVYEDPAGVNRDIVAWGLEGGPANGLQFRRDAANQNRANILFLGNDSHDGYFDDFKGSFLMSIHGENSLGGALIRAQNPFGQANTTGYWIGLNGRDGGKLQISIDPEGNNTNPGTVLAESSYDHDRLTGSDLAKIEFEVVGNRLSASAFIYNTESDGWDLLTSVVATDDTYTSGRFGFRSSFSWNGYTNYGDLQLTAIPEPSVYGLIFGGSILFFALIRRRKD